MNRYDAAIIGAGPAGIMAAITASERGRSVALIDRNPLVGKKLLATGNGRCNLTNAHISTERYHGNDLDFIRTVLDQFNQKETIEFFENLGLILKEEDNGRIFPRTNQASSVVEILRQKLERNKVQVLYNALVTCIEQQDSWKISFNDGSSIESDKLIIATGGKAAHQFGSTGDGWLWARQFGHNLTPYYAALVPIETAEQWPCEVQGTKVEARVWTTGDGRIISESSGDLLFTSYGVSGPAAMAQAGHIAPLLKSNTITLHIDLFPDFSESELTGIIGRIISNKKPLEDALAGLLPSGLIPIVLKLTGDSSQLSKTLKDLTLTVSKLRPFKEAQVTSGGLDSGQIDPHTLESRLVRGLYFAGEILDADGDSGGFNLQWAWSSGYAAGMAIDS